MALPLLFPLEVRKPFSEASQETPVLVLLAIIESHADS